MKNIIQCIDHGVYGVDPERCPLCPECDQPLWLGEAVTLQTVHTRPHEPDLLRLAHTSCVEDDDDEDQP